MTRFQFSVSEIEEKLYLFTEKTVLISGILMALPLDTQMEAIIDIMVAEAIITPEIEEEYLSRKDVMSLSETDWVWLKSVKR